MQSQPTRASLPMRILAIVVLALAVWFLLKFAIGIITGIATVIAVVAAIAAIVWAIRVL